MNLYLLVRDNAGRRFRSLVVAAIAVGSANALVVKTANVAAKNAVSPAMEHMWTFGLATLLFILGARFLYKEMAAIIEGVIDEINTRLTNKLIHMDVRTLERLGVGEVYDCIAENTTIISGASGPFAHLLQLVLIVAFGALYLAWLSLAAFVIVFLVLAVGVVLFRSRSDEIKEHLRKTRQTRLLFFERLDDLLKGFKELKLSQKRGSALKSDMTRAAHQLRQSAVKADILFTEKYVFGRVHYFILLAAVVFILPHYDTISAAIEPQILAAVMFAYGPISGILAGLPAMARAEIALDTILALEQKLDASGGVKKTETVEPMHTPFETIELIDVELFYEVTGDDEPFHLGPIRLDISQGELVFFVGGNGSGKSTLLKILTGLYPPQVGTLRVDKVPVAQHNIQAYREIVSAVHADFHLFKKLYGFEGVNPEHVHALLQKMRIAHKTTFANGVFSTIALSTGQRKRLALVVALLEDRSIYAFDEWAADQDPGFRKYFYDEILSELKARGKTILVASHDDRYFHLADRIVTLENGRIRSIENPRPKPLPSTRHDSA